MITITAQRTVSMGHRLQSYKGLCSSPHGHNMRVEVEVQGPVDTFLDFKDVDARLAQIVEPFDHAMLLEDNDPLVGVLKGFGFRVVMFTYEPTTEAIARRVFQRMQFCLDKPASWVVKRVTVFETDKYSATVTE